LRLKLDKYDATAPFKLKFEKEEGAEAFEQGQEKKNYAVPSSLPGFTHLVYKVLNTQRRGRARTLSTKSSRSRPTIIITSTTNGSLISSKLCLWSRTSPPSWRKKTNDVPQAPYIILSQIEKVPIPFRNHPLVPAIHFFEFHCSFEFQSGNHIHLLSSIR